MSDYDTPSDEDEDAHAQRFQGSILKGRLGDIERTLRISDAVHVPPRLDHGARTSDILPADREAITGLVKRSTKANNRRLSVVVEKKRSSD